MKKRFGKNIYTFDELNCQFLMGRNLKLKSHPRIGIVLDSAINIPPVTGLTYRLYYLSKSLSDQGIEQVWFIGDRNDYTKMAIESLKNDSIKIHLIPPHLFYKKNYLENVIKNERIDIVQFESSETLLMFYKEIKSELNIPILLEVHDIEAELRSSLGHAEEVDIMKFTQYCACSIADTVVCMTPHDKKSLIEHIGIEEKKIFLAPNGISKTKLLGIKKDRCILFLGNIYYPPNKDSLLYTIHHILPLVQKSCPDVYLKVIGMVPDDIKIKYAKNSEVKFTGPIHDEILLSKEIQSCVVGMCILFSGSGMKVKVLDYSKNGLPVILTKVGLSGFETNENLILTGENPKEIAREIISLFTNTKLANEIGKRNRDFVNNNFTWKKICITMRAAYASAQRAKIVTEKVIRLPEPFWLSEGRAKENRKGQHHIIQQDIKKYEK